MEYVDEMGVNQGSPSGQEPVQEPVQNYSDGQQVDNASIEQSPQEQMLPYAVVKAERERADQLKQEAEFYRNLALQNLNQKPVVEERPKRNPDDLADVQTVESIMNERLKQIEMKQMQERTFNSEQKARSKYNDYDDVLKFTEKLVAQNPGWVDIIRADNDPAEFAYRLGKSHPMFEQTIKQVATQQIASKIQENLSRPNTLTNTTGGAVKQSPDYYKTVDSATIEKMIHDVKHGRVV